MKILSIDTETTGLDIDTCEVIELGYALYDLSISADAPMLMSSDLLIPKTEITEEITDVTGITSKMVEEYGIQPDEAFLKLVNVINTHKPSFLLGHNLLGYDLPILVRYLDLIRDHAFVEVQPAMLDTRVDLPHKRAPKNNSLIFLSADIAKFCNPFSHRALFDCLATMKLLAKFNIHEVILAASSPLIEIRADVSFAGKDRAKKAGYNWCADRKIWYKLIRKALLTNETEKVDFPVLLLREQKAPSL